MPIYTKTDFENHIEARLNQSGYPSRLPPMINIEGTTKGTQHCVPCVFQSIHEKGD